MAARSVFLRTSLNNRLIQSLNSLRCLSPSCTAKGSKSGGSTEQKSYDVAIVGGGVMGSSSAYFLANRMPPGTGNICVIERDPTVSKR